jgi:hypothetical protein
MGKRGPKPKGQIKIKWSSNFAYAIGLLTTDGCLQRKGYYIDFTSKDIEQIENFKKCLGLNTKIGLKKSGSGLISRRIQFKDKIFYNFLFDIGLSPAKSKVIEGVKVPDKYFFDFLRGHLDGDGCFYYYWDKRWKSSFMFYLTFVSVSKKHIDWIRKEIKVKLGIEGHISKAKNNPCYQLKYAKKESTKLIVKIYYKKDLICLSRKRLKIKKILGSIVK